MSLVVDIVCNARIPTQCLERFAGTLFALVCRWTMIARILIVDADDSFRSILKEGLEELGYEVFGVASGVEGMVAALTLAPDAIVVELDLPDVEGNVLCQRLKVHPKTAGVPVLMVTVRGAPEARIRAFEAGADSVVLKPVGLRELQLRLRVLLPPRSDPAARNGTRRAPGIDIRKIN